MKGLISVLLFTLALMQTAARRLWANRRLALGLLVGFTVAVAASASVPLFTDASLQRVLQSEIAAAQQPHPASVEIAHVENSVRPTNLKQLLTADAIARNEGPALLGVPVDPLVRFWSTELGQVIPADLAQVNPGRNRWMNIAVLSDLDKHITLTGGRLPSPGKRADDYIETIVEDELLDKQDFTVGARLNVPLGGTDRAPIVKVVVVGSFRRTNPEDDYWFQQSPYEAQLFVPEAVFQNQILTQRGAIPGQYSWYFGIGTDQLRVADGIRLLSAMYDLQVRVAQALPDTELFSGPVQILTQFAYRANSLRLTLLLLMAPLLAVVAYFIVIISGMIVNTQRQEIAMLRSRGTGIGQILTIYGLEGLLLAGSSLLLGMPLAILVSRLMGACAGFLQFVDRKQPPLTLTGNFWVFGVGAAVLAMIAYVAPALPATGQSIVTYKQQNARNGGFKTWARAGVDLLFLGLAGYAYYTMRLGPSLPSAGAAGGSPQVVDPLIVVAPALFIIGAGMLVTRLLPLLGQAAALLADRWAHTPVYMALIQMGRASRSYMPVVFLLTLTVGMGLYSATAARTVERNATDRLQYAAGADVILNEVFQLPGAGNTTEALISPPWELHSGLPGVLHPARVREQEVTPSVGGLAQRKGTLMAINTPDFGRVAWFRSDLLRFHINAYLNLLAKDEEAVLVSTGFFKRNSLKLGDRITLTGPDGGGVSLVIYGSVDYWPALDPEKGDFFIANFDFIEDNLGLAPYQVWLRMESGAKLQPVVDALKQQSVLTVSAADTRQSLIQVRRDPYLNGLSGTLTIGFILSAILTMLGFWLHAALSARSRLLQFGVLRAIGLTGAQLTQSVILEQVLSLGAGVAAGTGLGLVAARLFVPFLQESSDAMTHTPPFLVVMAAEDRLRLYMVLLIMLALSAVGLVAYIGRLRIHEAVKLGEEH